MMMADRKVRTNGTKRTCNGRSMRRQILKKL